MAKTPFSGLRWLHGQSPVQLVPNLFWSITNRAKMGTVLEALTEMR
jgi:hypothetical protein